MRSMSANSLLPLADSGLGSPGGSVSRVVSLCSLANLINAADRVIMPIAIVGLAKEYNYSLHEQGLILSAFPAGYISSQIIGSCAAAQMGSRRLLLYVVFMWSLSTLLTPFVASSLHWLIITRIVLGLGEGLGLPTIYHMFSQNVPMEHRSRAFGYLNAFGSIGQVIAAVLTPHFEWRVAFYMFGIFGIMWCLLWLRYYEEISPTMTDQLPVLKQTMNPFRQWRVFFLSSSLWAIYVAHFSMNWTAYVIMHWLPTYLAHFFQAHAADLSLTALPYLMNSLLSIGVGYLADDLVNKRRYSVLYVRKLCTLIGLGAPALLLFAFGVVTHKYIALLIITLSMGLLALNSAGHLSNHADVCPKYAGITFAISNTIATIPGLVVGPLTAKFVLESSGRWWPVFVIAAMINMVGAVFYVGHASTKQIIS